MIQQFVIIVDNTHDVVIDNNGQQLSFLDFFDILCKPHYDPIEVRIYDATMLWERDYEKIGPDMAAYISDCLILNEDFPVILFEPLWRISLEISQWTFQGGVLC